MERVLIVARTDMKYFVCVGGLLWRTNGSVRLMSRDGKNQPLDSPFEVGQLWDIDYQPASKLAPPHIEDVQILRKRLVGRVANLREELLQRVQPWYGGPEQLFDRSLCFGAASAYVSRSAEVPKRSTGYWVPDMPLLLDRAHRGEKPYYQISRTFVAGGTTQQRLLSVPYVGFRAPVPEIPALSLVRVSLSRWWMTRDMDEERCYLQLSGWYD